MSSPRKRISIEEDIRDETVLPSHIAVANHSDAPGYTDAQRKEDLRSFFADTMAATGIVSAVKESQGELLSLKAEQDSTVHNANLLVGELSQLITRFKHEFALHDHRLLESNRQAETKILLPEDRSSNRDNSVLSGQRASEDHVGQLQQAILEQQRLIERLTENQVSTTGSSQNRVGDIQMGSFVQSLNARHGTFVQNDARKVNVDSFAQPTDVGGRNPFSASISQSDRFTQSRGNMFPDLDSAPQVNVGSDGRVFAGGRRSGEAVRGIPTMNRSCDEAERSRGDGSPKLPVLSNTRVNPPLVFGQLEFLTWGEDVLFWRDIYWYIEESKLLSVLSLNASPVLKKFLMSSLRRTRDQPGQRTLTKVIVILQDQFAASIREREMAYLDEMLTLKRESTELAQAFWYRYEELIMHLEGHAIQLPENMLFLRLLRALNVPNQVRLAIITRMDCQGMRHNVEGLKKVSIELLGIYKDVLNKSEGQAMVSDQLMTDDALIFAKSRIAKKPGMEVRSVRASMAASNFPNSTVKGNKGNENPLICYRCGAKDHILRDCPKPYTAQLMFAPKKGEGKGQKGRELSGGMEKKKYRLHKKKE